MSLARRGLLAGWLGTLLGGCSAAAMLNATVPRDGYSLEHRRDAGRQYGVARNGRSRPAEAAGRHKRAPTRDDVLLWIDNARSATRKSVPGLVRLGEVR